MEEENTKVICKKCNTTVANHNFCTNCGAPISTKAKRQSKWVWYALVGFISFILTTVFLDNTFGVIFLVISLVCPVTGLINYSYKNIAAKFIFIILIIATIIFIIDAIIFRSITHSCDNSCNDCNTCVTAVGEIG